MNNKAQTGTMSGLMIGLVLLAGVSVLAGSYLSSVATNYGVTYNETSFYFLNKTQESTELLNSMTDQFVNEEGAQTTDTDIISLMITNAYSLVKLFFNLPGIYASLVSSALSSLGIPAGVSAVLGWMAISIITILILFAAYEAIMKVRS